MTARLVGLLGLAGAGKDTAAAGLIAAGYQRRGFADPLKAMALAVDPYIPHWVTHPGGIGSYYYERLSVLVDDKGWEEAKREHEVRRLLQRLGTEGVRNHLGEDAWVEAWLGSLRADNYPPTVAPDVRFPNEAEAIRERGGVLIRIERPDHLGASPHVSEAGIAAIPVHFVVFNNGAPEHLQAQVLDIVKGWER